MNKTIIWIIVIALVAVGFWYFSGDKAPVEETTDETPEESVAVLSDGVYTLDVVQSEVAWTGSKTLIKDYYDNGRLLFTSGSVTVSDGAIATGTFTVDMGSFSVTSTGRGSGNDMLADHLKSDDFFDVATYPVATIDIQSVVDGTVTADVTIKGITKPVTFPASIAQDGDTITASATFAIDRTQWDVRYGSTKFFGDLGDNVINDTVNLSLTLVATKTQ